MKPNNFILIIILMLFNLNLFSQEPFKLGSPAPPINIYKWINKSPDTSSLNGKTIILEFWATWCRPCINTIPHLNDLVEKLANDSVIFISITKENPEKIESFLKVKEIKSFIAIDFNGTTNANYKINFIPRAFVIDSNGLIVWQGHPANLNEQILKFFIQKNHYKSKGNSEKK